LILVDGRGIFRDESERLRVRMENEPVTPKKHAPVFSLLSVIAPFAGVGLALIAREADRHFYPNDDSLASVAIPGLAIFGGFFGGVVMSIIAAVRHEKRRALGWIGFLLNAIPIVCMMIFS
jgi:O-antigen/teichoic acid export membrane protein